MEDFRIDKNGGKLEGELLAISRIILEFVGDTSYRRMLGRRSIIHSAGPASCGRRFNCLAPILYTGHCVARGRERYSRGRGRSQYEIVHARMEETCVACARCA